MGNKDITPINMKFMSPFPIAKLNAVERVIKIIHINISRLFFIRVIDKLFFVSASID